ncbi:MAG: ABC transporter substrate-binding protein [Proteobacteria bacterium]|nr:ABC transporter substrate-binding protein [Pseudomonadota bacterium]
MTTWTKWAATAAAVAIAAFASGGARAQAPKANGETLRIQNYAGTTGNMHAVVAAKKGFCEKYNFKCELKTLNSGTLGLQALVGKTIDIAQTGTELTAATGDSGLVLVGVSLPANVLSVSVRSDVPLPNKDKGYPAIMKDFKGLKIGTTARGSGGEVIFNAMLREAGMKPSDVTYVAVGGPATAYTSMVVGKQVDAAVLFQPLTQLCAFNKTCATVIDMTVGEGPKVVKEMTGASVPFVARREMADANPNLMAAFYAAFRDAAAWFNDPANFEELVKIYTPLISFGDMPGADQLRRNWIKSVIPAYSKDLKVDRHAVKVIVDFYRQNGMLDKPVDPAKLVWDKAP